MEKEKNNKSMIGKEDEKKINNETSDFLQLLKSSGMFVDCTSSIKDDIEEIEKKLK